jgi:hypothetical protein
MSGRVSGALVSGTGVVSGVRVSCSVSGHPLAAHLCSETRSEQLPRLIRSTLHTIIHFVARDRIICSSVSKDIVRALILSIDGEIHRGLLEGCDDPNDVNGAGVLSRLSRTQVSDFTPSSPSG